MKNTIATTAAIVAASSLIGLNAHAAPAHEHGKASLNLALQGKQLVVELESPLDNLLGFEYAPRTAAEKKQASQMIQRLQTVDGVFALPAAAKCVLNKVNLSSSALVAQLPASNKVDANPLEEQAPEPAGHADLDGEFTYTCQVPDQLKSLTVNLFKWFPHMHAIHVQWTNGKQQKAFELSAKQPGLTF